MSPKTSTRSTKTAKSTSTTDSSTVQNSSKHNTGADSEPISNESASAVDPANDSQNSIVANGKSSFRRVKSRSARACEVYGLFNFHQIFYMIFIFSNNIPFIYFYLFLAVMIEKFDVM